MARLASEASAWKSEQCRVQDQLFEALMLKKDSHAAAARIAQVMLACSSVALRFSCRPPDASSARASVSFSVSHNKLVAFKTKPSHPHTYIAQELTHSSLLHFAGYRPPMMGAPGMSPYRPYAPPNPYSQPPPTFPMSQPGGMYARPPPHIPPPGMGMMPGAPPPLGMAGPPGMPPPLGMAGGAVHMRPPPNYSVPPPGFGGR